MFVICVGWVTCFATWWFFGFWFGFVDLVGLACFVVSCLLFSCRLFCLVFDFGLLILVVLFVVVFRFVVNLGGCLVRCLVIFRLRAVLDVC